MAIDRDHAVRVALELLDEHGLEKLTVRRLAFALGVQAPALYWHFTAKRALLDHMTDVMLAPEIRELGHPGPGEPWHAWLERGVGAVRRGLLTHRDGARVALGADLRRAAALGHFADRATAVLHDAGFGLPDASRAAGALVHFVVGRTVEEQARPDPETERSIIDDEAFPFPHMARAMRERQETGATPEDDFRYSVGILLMGLRALHAQARDTRSPGGGR